MTIRFAGIFPECVVTSRLAASFAPEAVKDDARKYCAIGGCANFSPKLTILFFVTCLYDIAGAVRSDKWSPDGKGKCRAA